MINKHIALVNLNGFDPFLRDGASLSILSRLKYLHQKVPNVSIINFITNESNLRFRFFDSYSDTVNNCNMAYIGNSKYTLFHGLSFYQYRLPFGRQQLLEKPGTVKKLIVQAIQQHSLDYVLTLDQDHFSLFAAWFLNIPGAHFFNSLSNVKEFSRILERNTIINDRLVFTNSNFLKGRIEESTGYHSVVWYPYIDFSTILGRKSFRRIRSIGFVASSGWKDKGGDVVLKIAQLMPKCRFNFIGTKNNNLSFHALDNLTYMEHTSDMKRFYESIDILLVPSLIEDSFPRVIIEAAANGIPAIANQVGGISEALGESGVLINLNRMNQPDISDIAEKYVYEIHKASSDDHIYRSYHEGALRRAKEYQTQQNKQSKEIFEYFFC